MMFYGISFDAVTSRRGLFEVWCVVKIKLVVDVS
jgi:hypothetical protein